MAKDQVSLKFSSARSQLVQRSGNWKFQWLLFVRNWICDNFLWKRGVDVIMSCPQKSCVETIQCGKHPVVSIPSRVPPLSNFNKKFRSFCDFRAKITMPLAPAFFQDQSRSGCFNASDLWCHVYGTCLCEISWMPSTWTPWRPVPVLWRPTRAHLPTKSCERWVYRPKLGTIRKSPQGEVGSLIWGWYLCVWILFQKRLECKNLRKKAGSNVIGFTHTNGMWQVPKLGEHSTKRNMIHTRKANFQTSSSKESWILPLQFHLLESVEGSNIFWCSTGSL